MKTSTVIVLGLLGLGLMLLFLDNRRGSSSYYQDDDEQIIKLRPLGTSHRYQNEETWDIEWNTDGLPSKVTIHRNAIQS